MGVGLRSYQSETYKKYFLGGKAEGKAEGRAEGRAEGVVQGMAVGEATALLTVLAARGIEVPDDVRERITGCIDVAQLTLWVERAVTAKTVADLFA